MTEDNQRALQLAEQAAAGDARAIAAIEAEYFGKAKAAISGIRGIGALGDEVIQRVRERLFVAAEGRRPKIGDYNGSGDLARWIRTIAMRIAMDLLGPAREVPSSLEDLALSTPDPAVEAMKNEYGARFKQALRDAIAELPAESRDELRLYYLEGRGVEELGALRGVAPSTISRRLDKARRALREATRRLLGERLGVGEAELESILRLIETRLELSRSALE